MKKKGILLTAMFLLSTAGFIQAHEGELGVTLDVTYLSSYIWRGFDVYPEGHSAIQPSIDIDLYGTGFGAKVFSSRANGSGFENAEWLDYTLYYYNSFFKGETYAMNYMVGWTYYNFPDEPRKAADIQEVFAVFSWPKIFPRGIIPSYTVTRAWSATSDSLVRNYFNGWAHIFGLDYGLTLPGLLPETTKQVLNLHAEVVYNDGIGPCPQAPETVDHDWSHVVFGVSTAFALSDNLTFTPGIYYQASMDDSVNDDDETWCSLSMTYKF